MNNINIEYQYKLGQFIYHNTPESNKGIIIDITYSILTRLVMYKVAFGRGVDDEVLCYEHELTETKTF
mgnify:CR=1 FL=1